MINEMSEIINKLPSQNEGVPSLCRTLESSRHNTHATHTCSTISSMHALYVGMRSTQTWQCANGSHNVDWAQLHPLMILHLTKKLTESINVQQHYNKIKNKTWLTIHFLNPVASRRCLASSSALQSASGPEVLSRYQLADHLYRHGSHPPHPYRCSHECNDTSVDVLASFVMHYIFVQLNCRLIVHQQSELRDFFILQFCYQLA